MCGGALAIFYSIPSYFISKILRGKDFPFRLKVVLQKSIQEVMLSEKQLN